MRRHTSRSLALFPFSYMATRPSYKAVELNLGELIEATGAVGFLQA